MAKTNIETIDLLNIYWLRHFKYQYISLQIMETPWVLLQIYVAWTHSVWADTDV